jgi:hypothetical protein
MKTLIANGDFFVAQRCRFWLATVPSLPRDKRLCDDIDSSANDHLADCTSYLLVGAKGGVSQAPFGGRPALMPDTGNRVIYV